MKCYGYDTTNRNVGFYSYVTNVDKILILIRFALIYPNSRQAFVYHDKNFKRREMADTCTA